MDIEDLDLIFDIFLENGLGPDQRNEVTIQRFKDVLVQDMKVPNLKPQDLDMLLKSNQIFASKNKITRVDFKHVFEYALKQATINTIDARGQFQRSYAEAADLLK
jgi:hypothetical protein